MYALTILEPWASGIIYGTKRIENRGWRTRHRGPLLIHAGRSRKFVDAMTVDSLDVQELLPGLRSFEELRFGKLLGVVDVVDCLRVEELQGIAWAEGPWCWVLEKPRALAELLEWKGQQGLYQVPDEMMPKILW